MSIKDLYSDKSDIQGTGVRTSRAFNKGDFISYIPGKKVHFLSASEEDASQIPTWYGVTDKVWIDPGESIFRYLNHSCEPNAAIIGTKKLVARKKINIGDELTIDYSMTDADVNWKLDYPCKCATKKCRTDIGAIQTLPIETFQTHLPLIPKFFKKTYLKNNPDAKIE